MHPFFRPDPLLDDENSEIARLGDIYLDIFLSAILNLNSHLVGYLLNNVNSPIATVPVAKDKLPASSSPIFISAWLVLLRVASTLFMDEFYFFLAS